MLKAYLHFADGRLQVEEVEDVAVRFILTDENGDAQHVFHLREEQTDSLDEIDYDEITN